MGHEYDAIRNMEARMTALEQQFSILQTNGQALRETVTENTNALKEFIDIAQGFKFGLKALSLMETCAVWVTKIAGAVVILWAIWKFGVMQAIANYRIK
jgi:hypothetical protein